MGFDVVYYFVICLNLVVACWWIELWFC